MKRKLFQLAGTVVLMMSLSGCTALGNLTASDIKSLLGEAGLSLNMTDKSGKARTVAKTDIKTVTVDGKPLSADKYDVVNGQIKLKDVEKNKKFKMKIELSDGTIMDNLDLDTAEGKVNKATFVPGADGQMHSFDPNMDPEEAFKQQHAEDLLHRITVQLQQTGLTDSTLKAFGGKKSAEPTFHTLPDMAFDGTADGSINFDVQVLNLVGPNASDILDTTFFVAVETGGQIKVTKFKINKTDLQRQDMQTGALPQAQTVASADIQVTSTQTFASMTEAKTQLPFEEPMMGEPMPHEGSDMH